MVINIQNGLKMVKIISKNTLPKLGAVLAVVPVAVVDILVSTYQYTGPILKKSGRLIKRGINDVISSLFKTDGYLSYDKAEDILSTAGIFLLNNTLILGFWLAASLAEVALGIVGMPASLVLPAAGAVVNTVANLSRALYNGEINTLPRDISPDVRPDWNFNIKTFSFASFAEVEQLKQENNTAGIIRL
ncbi:hypothetical protein [Rickettsiales endosymbiont of Stachyamoeba lipophora]|uniref:hypothetical protein n=1 Tax=Rickettsiales endosymbiont of Stachyamoeba lipophora TaxID=2486578 RepID=UPI000F655EBE|nr:hypothetical protein [Rickettsiales endosymbiont of Stachyamoeba lipophora]AZL16339.1 hypothetical protein EF513_07360 [Rickettsiales endosymbiont of Stachyamoeba lipophora]